jgi:hypothetical protein
MQEVIAPGASLEMIARGFEPGGMVWSRLGFLLVSDVGQDAILRIDPRRASGEGVAQASAVATAVVRAGTGGARGLTFDRQARLLACESVARQLTRTERDGSLTILANQYRGPPNEIELDGGNGVATLASPKTVSDSGIISGAGFGPSYGAASSVVLHTWTLTVLPTAKRGVYHFECQIHFGMIGTVIVR